MWVGGAEGGRGCCELPESMSEQLMFAHRVVTTAARSRAYANITKNWSLTWGETLRM